MLRKSELFQEPFLDILRSSHVITTWALTPRARMDLTASAQAEGDASMAAVDPDSSACGRAMPGSH